MMDLARRLEELAVDCTDFDTKIVLFREALIARQHGTKDSVASLLSRWRTIMATMANVQLPVYAPSKL